jgi:glycosyltransferase involved in cell wall biosynthesis
MKVLYLLNYAGYGGSEKYIDTLIAALGEQITPFFVYNIYGPLAEKLERQGIPCVQLPMSKPFDFNAAKVLAKLCRENNIDVVHTHFMRENFIAVLAKRLYNSGTGVLNTVHMTERKSGVISFLNSAISKSNIATIAVSRSVLDNLRSERVQNPILIYNGVDCEYYSPNPVAHERFTVACVGRFSIEKGQKYLIEAAKQLAELQFIFAGDGELLQECKDSAPLNCEFLGYAEDTRELMNSADLYVCPSLEEALGISVLEAMACGLPSVVTNAGGLPELITAACGNVVFKGDSAALADAIREMANDTARRAECAGNALRRVRTLFNLTDTAQQTFELYAD